MVKSLEACSNSNRFLSPCTYFSFFFFCVCLLQTGTKCREFIWSSVPFNDASGPSFKHTPTTNSAAQVISTQKAEPKKYWKRVGFRNLNILRWHYQWQWLELWMQQGRIGIFISFTSSRITTRVLQPAKTKLSGWQTSKLPEQVVPVAAVHKIVSLSIWSWDVMKPEPFLGLSPLRCLLMLAMLEPFLNAVFTPKDSVTLLLRIQNLKTKKWVFKKIYMATHQVFFSLHFTCGSWLASFESSSYRRKRDISIVWIHYKTHSVGYFLHFSGLGWFPFTNLSRSSGEMGMHTSLFHWVFLDAWTHTIQR